MRTNTKFKPHPSLKRVYYIYLLLASIIPLTATSVPICATYAFAPGVWQAVRAYVFIPLIVVTAVMCFVAYWVGKYYESITYTLGDDEIMAERGYGGR